MNDSIIYELHVKGFTATHPRIIPEERGTYKALTSPIILDYFKKLGITTIELMPVHHFVHDWFLVEKGLTNYWGYNTIGFFAPHDGQKGSSFLNIKSSNSLPHLSHINSYIGMLSASSLQLFCSSDLS